MIGQKLHSNSFFLFFDCWHIFFRKSIIESLSAGEPRDFLHRIKMSLDVKDCWR